MVYSGMFIAEDIGVHRLFAERAFRAGLGRRYPVRGTAAVSRRIGYYDDPSAPELTVKTGPTPRMVGNGFRERRDIAEGPLRDALRVTRPEDVRGRVALVYDDVFTDGLTLNEVARTLRLAGAVEVCGITLCRQPYGGQALIRRDR